MSTLKIHKSEKVLNNILKKDDTNLMPAAFTPCGKSSKMKIKFSGVVSIKEECNKMKPSLQKNSSPTVCQPSAFKSKSSDNRIKPTIEIEIINTITPHLERMLQDIDNKITREYETSQIKLIEFINRINMVKIANTVDINTRYELDLKRLEQLIESCKCIFNL
jgi:hypothetical protein